MMRHAKLLIVSAALVVFAAPVASAWFTATGTGSAMATSATLAAPSITTATPAAGAVTLAWSQITPPASGPVTYYVTRDGGVPAGDCATASAPTAATSCSDSGLAAGSHSYTVVAVWRSWTATSAARPVTIASAAATHLVLAVATTTPIAGAADDLTITAKDAAGNTVTGYAGDKSLTFGGAAPALDGTSPTVSDAAGTPRSLGTATSLTFAGGVASAAGASNGVLRLYRAGTATITATDGTIDSNALDVTVAPAAAARLAVSGYPSSTVAGVSHAFAVTALDPFANTASGYAGTVSFSASDDAHAVPPANATLTSGSRSFSATFKTVAGGAKTLTATDTTTPSITGSQSGISVTAGSAATITVVSGSGQSARVSAAFASPLVALVSDAFGNPVAGAPVTFAGPLAGAGATFASAGCTSNAPVSRCVTTTTADGRATTSAISANATAGAYQVSADASDATTAAFSLTNTIDTFEVTVPSPQTAGTGFTATITAKSGGATNTSYTGTKCIVFSGPANSPAPVNRAPSYPGQGTCAAGQSSVAFSAGVASASATVFKAGSATALVATQGTTTGASQGFAVNSAGVALAYDRTCPVTIRQTTLGFVINVPVDAFGNTFTRQSPLGIGLTLTPATHFGFGTVDPGSTTVSITTGPANNTFSVTQTGNNKNAELTATAPAGFTPPAGCALSTG